MIIFIDLIMVLEAILRDKQPCEKLQCSYENLMSKNFRKLSVLSGGSRPRDKGGGGVGGRGAVLGIHWCKYSTDLV